MVFPVVLGEGKRLFGPTGDKKRLRLSDSQTVGDGVVVLTYERTAGRVGAAPAGGGRPPAGPPTRGCRLPPLVTCQTGRWPT